jgi:mono/diheme cytochrome c family protein
MPEWNELHTNDLRALAAYVRSLEAEPTPPTRTSPLSDAEQAQAGELYVTNCARCHGRQGRGDGIGAGALAPPPTDFVQVRPSLAYAEEVLAQGVAGTAMPPWQNRLDGAQRRLLARYVRWLYQQGPSPR